MLPSTVRLYAACVPPGRRVVVLAAGKAYELPAPVEQPVPPPPAAKSEVQVLFEQAAASFAESAARISAAESSVRDIAAQVAAGQTSVEESVRQMADVLKMPTEPIYNDAGKLIGAQRVQKLRG